MGTLTTNNKNKLELFKSNPSKALWILSLPMMLGMSVQAIYMLIDTAFIGNLVQSNTPGAPLAGLGLVFPPMFIIMGITFGLGSGATAVIAKNMGEENIKKANSSANHTIFLGIILSILFILIGIFWGEKIISYQNQSPEVIKHALDYFYIMLIGTFFMILSVFFRSILSGEGDNILSMKILGVGTVINLILDPILILTMQIKGAALATVISQIIVFSGFIYMLVIKKSNFITPSIKSFKYDRKILSNILYLGVPASASMVLMSMGVYFYNIILSKTETPMEAIAAYSTAHRIEHLFFIPLISIATSMVTLVGMFIGAKRKDLIDKVIIESLKNSVSISIMFGILFFTCSQFIFHIFTDNPKIIEIGVDYFKIFAFAVPFVSVGMICSRVMQGLGEAYPMFILTFLRVVAISCLLAHCFINCLNKPLYFAWYAILISCICSSIISLFWMLHIRKKIIY